MRISTPLDEILWQSYRSRPPRPVPVDLNAPRNYVELAGRIDFDADRADIWQSSRSAAWSSFLHAFFHFKSEMFFEKQPPDFVPVEEQALWAGVAEGLCQKLDLRVPQWTNEPRYFLVELWDSSLFYSILSSSITQRLSECDPEFSRRNVVARIRDFLVA
jgi:hypothetical protein